MSTKVHSDSVSVLFELFDNSADSNKSVFMRSQQSIPTTSVEAVDASRPRQVLGESVFSHFAKSQQLNHEFPLDLTKLDASELSPSVGTVSPFELHSSFVESIFSPSLEDSSPMFEDVDLDSSNWKSLFEPSEMEIPPVPVRVETVSSLSRSPNFTTALPTVSSDVGLSTKRSSSEAELSDSLSKRSNSLPTSVSSETSKDQFGIVTYNRKQRTQPLTPIIPESDDPLSQKRARNTEAARRSRARKMERMNQLEDKVEDLVKRNTELEDEVSRLRALLAQR